MFTKAMDMDKGECFRWHNDVYRVSDTVADSSENIKVFRIMTYWPQEKVWKWVNPANAHEEDFNPMCRVSTMQDQKFKRSA